jgi:histidine ammonia-lyase
MIAQYTAAALVSENKVLSHPACVDSIPTSANKEDHVPMSPISARKARDIVSNAEHVIAIELLCGAQALDLLTNLKPGRGTLAAYEVIRGSVSHLERDRVLACDLEKTVQLMKDGRLLEAVEDAIGTLL